MFKKTSFRFVFSPPIEEFYEKKKKMRRAEEKSNYL